MKESKLPEAVVKLICEYTGTREQWTRKKKEILNGQIVKLKRLYYEDAEKTSVKHVAHESNCEYSSYDVKEHINQSMRNIKNLRGIYREQELFYRETFIYDLVNYTLSGIQDFIYGDDIRRLVYLSYTTVEENKHPELNYINYKNLIKKKNKRPAVNL